MLLLFLHIIYTKGFHVQEKRAQSLTLVLKIILLSTRRMAYPDPSAFCSNIGYVLAKEICFIFRKHEVRSKLFVNQRGKEFTPDLMFTKYEADLLCQNMP